MPATPSDRAVSPSATIDGANVPSEPSTNIGRIVPDTAGARPRIITSADRKHVHDMAYVSAKKPNAADIALERLTCGSASSVVVVIVSRGRLTHPSHEP